MNSIFIRSPPCFQHIQQYESHCMAQGWQRTCKGRVNMNANMDFRDPSGAVKSQQCEMHVRKDLGPDSHDTCSFVPRMRLRCVQWSLSFTALLMKLKCLRWNHQPLSNHGSCERWCCISENVAFPKTTLRKLCKLDILSNVHFKHCFKWVLWCWDLRQSVFLESCGLFITWHGTHAVEMIKPIYLNLGRQWVSVFLSFWTSYLIECLY